jgi:hypothetical protein
MNEKVISMDCAQFEKILHDLDRPGTDGFARRGGALAHAETCGRCGRLMTEVESLDFSLRALAARGNDWQAPSRVGTALMAEYRRERVVRDRLRMRWQITALGTAAALLLALGFSLRHRAALGPDSGRAGDASGNSLSRSSVPETSAEAQQSQAVDVDLNDSEYATAFVPLPFADDPAGVDGGAVVRVVLSRPALASLGVPVTDMEATDRIPADIVLSEDGVPQAIRLVSQSDGNE